MFFGISLIPLAVLIIVGQLKKAPRTSPKDPGYQEQKEQARKHLCILDVLGVVFALALMIIQWSNVSFSLAFHALFGWFPGSCIGSGRSSMCRVGCSSRVL